MSSIDKLVMAALHTQPTSAVAEIDALVDVVAWAEKVSNNSLANTLHYLYLLLFLCSYVPYFPQKKFDDFGAENLTKITTNVKKGEDDLDEPRSFVG